MVKPEPATAVLVAAVEVLVVFKGLNPILQFVKP